MSQTFLIQKMPKSQTRNLGDLQKKVAKTGAYSNRWQSGYYASEIDSDCGTIPLPALIHVRAYLYAGTSR